MFKRKRDFGSAIGKFSQKAKAASDSAAQRAKSAGETAMEAAKVAGDVSTERAKSVGGTATEKLRVAGEATQQGAGVKLIGDAATRAASTARDVAGQGVKMAGDRIEAISSWDSVMPEQARDSLAASIESSKSLSGSAKQKLTAQMGPALERLSTDGQNAQVQAFGIIQGLLASDQISRAMNAWFQDLVSGRATIYDKAMDSVYHQTGVGGNYHRLFDGGHTLTGAFQAVRNASPDDSIFEEAAGLLQALARDATTPRGLPLVTWEQDTFNNLAGAVENFGISRAWLNDMVSYDAVELIAGSIGIVAVALNWNNDDVEEFSNITGMGLSAVVSANPLMLIVTVVALARSFHLARKSGDWKEFTDGLAKGGICTGAVLLATSLVSGPAVVVLLTGICVGILANQATKRVSFVEIGQFVVLKIREAPLALESGSEPVNEANQVSA